MQRPPKKILLVDNDDTRRETRVGMLRGAEYDVECRADHEVSEALDREGTFNLLILALHQKKLEEAAAYSERLRKKKPTLPILLLTDVGVFAPHGTLSRRIATGFPEELMLEVAEMHRGQHSYSGAAHSRRCCRV